MESNSYSRSLNNKTIVIHLILILAGVFLIAGLISFAESEPVYADSYDVEWNDNTLPAPVRNLCVGLRRNSYLHYTDGGYMRVFYNGEKVGIEYYNSDFKMLKQGYLSLELDYWGGFYAGSDAYYIVSGKSNTDENDTAEVIRIVRYDFNWNRIGAASITGNTGLFGGRVRYPFNTGCVNMAECGDKLYLVTGHEGYVDPSEGQGHQGFLMIEVDKSSMTGSIIQSDLWHSFAQYIECKDDILYILEQSEGGRCTKLNRYVPGTDSEMEYFSVLDYGGSRVSAWAVPCYASVDGMALSDDSVLCIGTSIDQTAYDSVTDDTAHNIYLTITPFNNFNKESTVVKWLTSYKGEGKSFIGLNLTKVNDDRFLVSWEEYYNEDSALRDADDVLSGNTIHYQFIDGSGNKIGREFSAAAAISSCMPILADGNVAYYASDYNMVDFYLIDARTGKLNKVPYRVAGDSVSWSVDGTTLKLEGKGDIKMYFNSDRHRLPLSSSRNWFITHYSDCMWKGMDDTIKIIRLGKGITSISDSCFAYFDQLNTVLMEDGMRSIGKEAFAHCDCLGRVLIPASVTSIGEDITWCGLSTPKGQHISYTTIYSTSGSYAIEYAKKNSIDYEVILPGTDILADLDEDDISWESDKKAQTLTAKGKKITLKKKTLKKKSITVKRKKALKIKKAKGKLSYKLISVNKAKKYFKVKKNGNIVVKKGLKKGKYKLKIKVSAGGNKNYDAGSKTATVTIKVK